MCCGVKTLGQSPIRVAVCGTPSEFPVFGKWSPNSSSGWWENGGGPKPPLWWEGGGLRGSIQKKNNWWFRAAEVRAEGK